MDADISRKELTSPPTTPLSLEELQARLSPLQDTFRNRTTEQKKLEAFIEDQIKGRDRYQHIFKTSNGSIYLTLNTGESVRIKNDQGRWKLQPTCSKLFFVDESQSQKLKDMQESYQFDKEVLSSPIKTTSIDLGVTPIEFGIIGFPPIKFTEDDEIITILGDPYGEFASGFHQGHQVSEIIK